VACVSDFSNSVSTVFKNAAPKSFSWVPEVKELKRFSSRCHARETSSNVVGNGPLVVDKPSAPPIFCAYAFGTNKRKRPLSNCVHCQSAVLK